MSATFRPINSQEISFGEKNLLSLFNATKYNLPRIKHHAAKGRQNLKTNLLAHRAVNINNNLATDCFPTV